jgi:hypothetical protein
MERQQRRGYCQPEILDLLGRHDPSHPPHPPPSLDLEPL